MSPIKPRIKKNQVEKDFTGKINVGLTEERFRPKPDAGLIEERFTGKPISTNKTDAGLMETRFRPKPGSTTEQDLTKRDDDFTGKVDVGLMETDFTGKSSSTTEKDLTAIIQGFEQLNAVWDFELRTPLHQRPRRVYVVPIEYLEPLKGLTLRRHGEEKINLLSESIKKTGVLHNLIVTIPCGWREWNKQKLSIVCGVGRWLASKKAGLKSVKVELIALNNLDEAYLLSITENLERTELSKIEEAEFYVGWINEANVPLRDIAAKIKRSESYVSNIIRLKLLPVKVQEWIHEGKIPYSFGLSLLEIKNPTQQEELAKMVIEDKLTRTQLEAKINEVKGQETLARMTLDVEKPEIKQPEPQTTSPIQRASQQIAKKPFVKEPESKIERITGDIKLSEKDWWLSNLSATFEHCQYNNCATCSVYDDCYRLLVYNIRRHGPPPKDYWKLIKFLYETARLSNDITLYKRIEELESAGFDSTEIKQEIDLKNTR